MAKNKISEKQINEIAKMVDSGMKLLDIAQDTGIHKGTISKIKRKLIEEKVLNRDGRFPVKKSNVPTLDKLSTVPKRFVLLQDVVDALHSVLALIYAEGRTLSKLSLIDVIRELTNTKSLYLPMASVDAAVKLGWININSNGKYSLSIPSLR